MEAQLSLYLDWLVDSMSQKSDYTYTFRDKKGCNIEDVMEEIHSIDCV
jgi:hypothetical protein